MSKNKKEEINNQLRNLYNNKEQLEKFKVVFNKYTLLKNAQDEANEEYKNNMKDLFENLKQEFDISKPSFNEIYKFHLQQEGEKDIEIDNQELLSKITEKI